PGHGDPVAGPAADRDRQAVTKPAAQRPTRAMPGEAVSPFADGTGSSRGAVPALPGDQQGPGRAGASVELPELRADVCAAAVFRLRGGQPRPGDPAPRGTVGLRVVPRRQYWL